jgi:hypothetical protein
MGREHGRPVVLDEDAGKNHSNIKFVPTQTPKNKNASTKTNPSIAKWVHWEGIMWLPLQEKSQQSESRPCCTQVAALCCKMN